MASHFELAELPECAITYLLQASQRAVRVSAYQEALSHLNQSLSLLESMPETQQSMQQELDLQVSLGVVLMASEGWGSSKVEHVYSKARELCRHVGDTSQHFHVLRALHAFYIHRAAHGPYDRMNIWGATGLTPVQRNVLKSLGAVEENPQDVEGYLTSR
ncbi:MAG: hypothetical protein AAF702_42405 [Chloroflexota bacterium]